MTVSGTPGTGTITLSAASSGYQSFATAYGANATVDILIEEGTAWEVARDCTYTNSGTTVTRGTLEASSTGSAVSFTSAAVVSEIATATKGSWHEVQLRSVIPGGRLTLESGVPVSTTDQTAKTTIYYTPFVHNVINLWDGANWVPTEFAETSLALGTITSGKPYDVFGYLSAGALVLEMLVWTSDLVRATAVTLQDGRYCKDGDKTRLLLGTFYTVSTTTTEDSLQNRYLSNVYNRVPRTIQYSVAASHTYNSTTYRDFNGAVMQMACVTAIAQNLNQGALRFVGITTTATPRVGIDQNVTSPGTGLLASQTQASTAALTAVGPINAAAMAAGRHYFRGVEKCETAATADFSSLTLYLPILC